jgi:hypothetical protein
LRESGLLCSPFAGKPAPTGTAQRSGLRRFCGSGFTREEAGSYPAYPSKYSSPVRVTNDATVDNRIVREISPASRL